jgi:arabinofuranan 3-O-arabinosyltransferase
VTDGSTATVRRWPPPRSLWTWGVHLVVVVSVLVLNLVQQPGRITFDTKLDLQLAPADFLARSADLWNADWVLGGLQNQASGYLFPMGPAFMLGELLGVPMWVWQRLWSAAVMLLAYEGARRLASRWPGIGTAGAVLAGVAYMLSPRVLTTVGGLSGETLPAAVLPWTLLPLVLFLHGHMRGWVAFVLSAATVPVMGGQNATLVVACLILPGLLLASNAGRSLRQRVTDLAAWGSLVVLASLWWVAPLLLLGSYAPPFLDFIESARNTAGATGWLSSLRGTSHWVAFFPGGGRLGWTGGYELASSRVILFTSVAIAAIGLAGLLQRRLRHRRVLALSVLIGLAFMTAGTGGMAGSVFSDTWLYALDTSLAPLRNVHKFDPLVRLPLCLGLGAWVTAVVQQRQDAGRSRRPLLIRSATVTLTTCLAVAAATPAATGSLRTDDGFEAIPASWTDAVEYLDSLEAPTRTLVLPGSTFAIQTWGRTIDEPVQVLDPTPWLSRAQLSVAPASTVRVLEALERALADGRPPPDVAARLHALGVTHVIVRNDLDLDETDAAANDLLAASLAQLDGARRLAAFGDARGGGAELEVYQLASSADPRVDIQNWGARAVVSGAPEVVPELRSAGLVDDHQAVVLADAGDPLDVVTDSLRRVERSFGRAYDAGSAVMTQTEPYRLDRPRHDYLDDAMPSDLTVAQYDAVTDIVASTSAGYADAFGRVRPGASPSAAFDGSYYTAWEPQALADPEGQWIEIRFARPTELDEVSLTFDTTNGAAVRTVRVETESQSLLAEVGPDGVASDIGLRDGAATSLRITIEKVDRASGGVRLADVRLPGIDVTRSLVLPGEVSAETAVFSSAEVPRRACGTLTDGSAVCRPDRQLETSESAGFDRTMEVAEPGTWRVAATAIATNGPELDRLVAPLSPDLVSITATSTLGGDPALAAAGVLDGRATTGWTSAPGDEAAALELSWGSDRTVTRIEIDRARDHPGELPDAFVVDGGPGTGEPQLVSTTGARAGEMRAVRTDRLRITAVGRAGPEGIGVSEMRVDGIEDLLYRFDLDGNTGTACGFGPSIEIGGQAIETRVAGPLSDVRSGAALEVVPCGRRIVSLRPGPAQITVRNAAGFAVKDLLLLPDARPSVTEPGRAVVEDWSATERKVGVSVVTEAVLGVNESFNTGWSASIDGRQLEPVVLDGWRQGFVVPSGTVGVADLVYEPQQAFRAALVGGVIVAAGLMLLALFLLLARPGRSSGTLPAPLSAASLEHRPAAWTALLAVAALALVSLPLAAGAAAGRLVATGRVGLIGLAATLASMIAAVVAVSQMAVVVPPTGADVLVAIAVGAVCGRVLLRE